MPSGRGSLKLTSPAVGLMPAARKPVTTCMRENARTCKARLHQAQCQPPILTEVSCPSAGSSATCRHGIANAEVQPTTPVASSENSSNLLVGAGWTSCSSLVFCIHHSGFLSKLSAMRDWERSDSNREPRDYESPALTVELRSRGYCRSIAEVADHFIARAVTIVALQRRMA